MTKKEDKVALQVLIDNYKQMFDAPVGKKRCGFVYSADCLGVASKNKFHYNMCKECVKVKMRILYDKRMIQRGKDGNPVRDGPGRPRKVVVSPKKNKSSTVKKPVKKASTLKKIVKKASTLKKETKKAPTLKKKTKKASTLKKAKKAKLNVQPVKRVKN